MWVIFILPASCGWLGWKIRKEASEIGTMMDSAKTHFLRFIPSPVCKECAGMKHENKPRTLLSFEKDLAACKRQNKRVMGSWSGYRLCRQPIEREK